MAEENPAFIPDEEDIMSATKKGTKQARFAVSATITGRGNVTTNFATEVEARTYMRRLRDDYGVKLQKCKMIPIG